MLNLKRVFGNLKRGRSIFSDIQIKDGVIGKFFLSARACGALKLQISTITGGSRQALP